MRELLVKMAVKLGLYKRFVAIDTYFKEHKEKRAMKKFGLETLIEADKVVSAFGGRMFLAFGTLLGAYREHDFIAHDCDIDVGLMASERPENMLELMKAAGFVLRNQQYVKETGRIVVDRYERKNVGIDFFYFFDDDRFSNDSEYADNIYTYIAYRHETKDWREANVTDGFPTIIKPQIKTTFSRKNFLGYDFYMPEAVEQWLVRLYGEHYMTPDPKWSLSDHKTRSFPSGERVYRNNY